MNTTNEIHSPSISVQLLFSADHSAKDKAPAGCIHLGFPEQLALTQKIEQPDYHLYQGQLNEDMRVEMVWCLAHDTHLLRLRFSLPGLRQADAWTRLKESMDVTLNSR
jgi:hypothetical protein